MARFARTTFAHRCPACGRGPLFARGFRLHARCPSCDQELEGSDGAQYGGPIVLGYTVGGLAGLVAYLLLWLRFGDRNGILVAAGFVTVAAVLLSFRSCKAFWTWLLFVTGQLDPVGGPRSDR